MLSFGLYGSLSAASAPSRVEADNVPTTPAPIACRAERRFHRRLLMVISFETRDPAFRERTGEKFLGDAATATLCDGKEGVNHNTQRLGSRLRRLKGNGKWGRKQRAWTSWQRSRPLGAGEREKAPATGGGQRLVRVAQPFPAPTSSLLWCCRRWRWQPCRHL